MTTLTQMGEWIDDPAKGPAPLPPALSSGKPATASSVDQGYHARRWTPDAVVDDNISFVSYWNADHEARNAWIEIDLLREESVGRVELYERINPTIQQFVIEYQVGDGWLQAATGTTVGAKHVIDFPPVKARKIRLTVVKSSGSIRLEEFRVLPPAVAP